MRTADPIALELPPETAAAGAADIIMRMGRAARASAGVLARAADADKAAALRAAAAAVRADAEHVLAANARDMAAGR